MLANHPLMLEHWSLGRSRKPELAFCFSFPIMPPSMILEGGLFSGFNLIALGLSPTFFRACSAFHLAVSSFSSGAAVVHATPRPLCGVNDMPQTTVLLLAVLVGDRSVLCEDQALVH